jgi:hypothetical protein
MPAGRPTTYTPELAKYVCKIIATHSCGLKKLTKMYERFPSQSTIYDWIYDYPEFSGQYLDARRLQAAVLADSMLDIPDEIPVFEDKEGIERIDSGMLGRAKLDCEILKWHASKMAPKIFGDKQQVEQVTTENDQLKAELAELRAKLADKSKAEY